jgi:hypothetical protein
MPEGQQAMSEGAADMAGSSRPRDETLEKTTPLKALGRAIAEVPGVMWRALLLFLLLCVCVSLSLSTLWIFAQCVYCIVMNVRSDNQTGWWWYRVLSRTAGNGQGLLNRA